MFCHFGRGGRTRTADPRVPNAVRYQLRYTPAGTSIIRSMGNRQVIPTFALLLFGLGWMGAVLTACQSPQPTTPIPAVATATAPVILTPTLTPRVTIPTQVDTSSVPLCIEAKGVVRREMLETPILPGQLYYTIYLPPCYSDEQEYPVLYLFHGLSFSDDQWVRLGMTDAADRLIGAGEITPLVIVMPYNPKADRPPHSNFGSAFTGALIPYIDTHYSTQIDADGRWIGGLSRGGGWAFDIFTKNPELFSVVGGHSPALFQRVPERFLESMEQAWSGQRVWLDVGEQDKELNYLTRVDADLTAENIPHVLIVEEGEHDEIYWQAHVEEYLRWYAE